MGIRVGINPSQVGVGGWAFGAGRKEGKLGWVKAGYGVWGNERLGRKGGN